MDVESLAKELQAVDSLTWSGIDGTAWDTLPERARECYRAMARRAIELLANKVASGSRDAG